MCRPLPDLISWQDLCLLFVRTRHHPYPVGTLCVFHVSSWWLYTGTERAALARG